LRTINPPANKPRTFQLYPPSSAYFLSSRLWKNESNENQEDEKGRLTNYFAEASNFPFSNPTVAKLFASSMSILFAMEEYAILWCGQAREQ
jgi:hypothetical protein